MNRLMTTVVVAGSLVVVCAIGVRASRTPAASPQGAPPAPPNNWKNLQVLTELKTAPDIVLGDTMDVVAVSLGVGCDTCHRGAFDADVLPTKARARDMMKMVRAINDANFGGRPMVTCQTCHQGHLTPSSTPAPWSHTTDELAALRTRSPGPVPAASTTTPTATWPSADTVLASYRNAVGAASLKSLRMRGTFAGAFTAGTFEIAAVYPDQVRVSSVNTLGATTNQIVNHDHAWTATPDSRAAVAEAQRQRLIADFGAKVLLPTALFAASRVAVVGVDRVGSRSCYVIEADTPAGTERLYFDTESSLLLKLRRETATPLGTSVRETDWSDYRDMNGVTRPFAIADHLMGNEIHYVVTSIETDVTIDPAIFEPPAPKPLVAITLPPSALDAVAGRYQVAPGNIATITHEGTQLFLMQSVGGKVEVLAESETAFFIKDNPIRLTFVKSASGDVTAMVVHQNGATRECPKVK